MFHDFIAEGKGQRRQDFVFIVQRLLPAKGVAHSTTELECNSTSTAQLLSNWKTIFFAETLAIEPQEAQ